MKFRNELQKLRLHEYISKLTIDMIAYLDEVIWKLYSTVPEKTNAVCSPKWKKQFIVLLPLVLIYLYLLHQAIPWIEACYLIIICQIMAKEPTKNTYKGCKPLQFAYQKTSLSKFLNSNHAKEIHLLRWLSFLTTSLINH